MKKNDRDLLAEYLIWTDPAYQKLWKRRNREIKRIQRTERREERREALRTGVAGLSPTATAPLLGILIACFAACLAGELTPKR